MWRRGGAAAGAAAAGACFLTGTGRIKAAWAYGPADAYGSDTRPRCWEEVREKYVPIFSRMKGDADASSLLCAFEGTAQQIEAPVERVNLHGASVSILGVCHFAKRSVQRVEEFAAGRDAVVLEICEERAAPILGCPAILRRRWLTSTIPDAEASDCLWTDFALDQLHAATAEGDEMAAAVAHDPELVVLADPALSGSDMDDPGRDVLLATACLAAVRVGCADVLCVVGADHVGPVAEALRNGAAASAEDLAVECSGGAAKAWFLGRRALRTCSEQRVALSVAFRPETLAAMRHEAQRPGALRAFEEQTELFGLAMYKSRPGSLIRRLGSEGLACSPAKISELRAWIDSERAHMNTCAQ